MPTITALLARAAALSVFLAVPMATVQPAAAAPAPRCPKAPKHVVVKAPKRSDGYAYVVGRSLYGCGRSFLEAPPRAHKLGPWTADSKVFLEDGIVTWTLRRTTASGTSEDRIWVSRLSGESLVGGVAAAREPADRIVNTLLPGSSWVTEGGTVAVARPRVDPPHLIGDDTPGAAGLGGAPGLAKAPKPVGPRLEIGRWGAEAVPTLVATYTFTYDDPGLSDGCAGVEQYTATVVPVSGQPPVGATWLETVYSTSEGC